MIAATATEDSPWYVVPADNKWFTRLVVSTVIVDTLESLGSGVSEDFRSRAEGVGRGPEGIGSEEVKEFASMKAFAV